MKIHALSDVHLEFEAYTPPKLNADVVLLAGDIHVGKAGIEWAQRIFPKIPVIYIPGNHEYYDSVLQENLANLKASAKGSHVHVLDNDSIVIEGVTFFGCTLWTDFNLHGVPRSAKNLASRYINDYEAIEYGLNRRKLRTHDTHSRHQKSIQWLTKNLKSNFDRSVVITHHAPSAKSLPDDFVNQEFEAAYASSLDDLVYKSNASLWVHGHIHASSDYMIGQTRVVCNPRGYDAHQNPMFKPNLIIEV